MLQTLHAHARRQVPEAGLRHEPRHGRLPDERLAARPAAGTHRRGQSDPRRAARDEGDDRRAARASSTPRSTKCPCCAKRARPRKSRLRSTAGWRLPELACDGVLVATPAGSTAYNLSARGPILPLQAKMLALTPISPFRPRRWSGAILPDDTAVCLRVLEAENRPVSAVADQVEVRDVSQGRSAARPRALAHLAVRSRACARRADRDGAIRDVTDLPLGKLRYLARLPCSVCEAAPR